MQRMVTYDTDNTLTVDTLERLRPLNIERCKKAFGHDVEDWSNTDWATAVAGETGELCNLVKKHHRGDFEGKEAGFRMMAAKEAADIVIYLDLLCARNGISLCEAIIEKFNEVSDSKGCDVKF